MANCYLASHAFAGTTPGPNVHPCYKRALYVTHFKSALSFGEAQLWPVSSGGRPNAGRRGSGLSEGDPAEPQCQRIVLDNLCIPKIDDLLCAVLHPLGESPSETGRIHAVPGSGVDGAAGAKHDCGGRGSLFGPPRWSVAGRSAYGTHISACD